MLRMLKVIAVLVFGSLCADAVAADDYCANLKQAQKKYLSDPKNHCESAKKLRLEFAAKAREFLVACEFAEKSLSIEFSAQERQRRAQALQSFLDFSLEEAMNDKGATCEKELGDLMSYRKEATVIVRHLNGRLIPR